MTETETTATAEDELRAYEAEVRDKYSQADRDGSVVESKGADDPALELRRQRVADLRASKSFEHRRFPVADCEFRGVDDDGMLRFSGYASLTEVPYPVGGFTETIRRGAFVRTLKEQPDVVFRVEHEGLPLARTERAHSDAPGTLRLEETERGLKVDARFHPDDPDAQTLKMKMERGLVDEMSFAFRCTDDDWSDDLTDRYVRSVTMHGGDVSAVTFGASPTTGDTTSIRSVAGEFELRSGKVLSKAKEEKVKGLLDKIEEIGNEAAELLPPEPEPDPVVPFTFNSLPDLTARAAQDLDLLRMGR